MKAQTSSAFTWALIVDSESPRWLRERLARLAPDVRLIEMHGPWDSGMLRVSLRNNGWAGGTTTRIDSDDVLLPEFVERVQCSVRRHGEGVHAVPFGYQLCDDQIYWRFYPQNPFVSLNESYRTAFDFPHWDLRGERIHFAGWRPGWVQVVHGGNLANEVRGVRIRGRRASRHFAAAGIEVPNPVECEAGWFSDASKGVASLAAASLEALPRVGRVAMSSVRARGGR